MAEKLLKSRKVNSYSNDGFSTTILHKILFCGNPEGNNNKFYSIELQQNPTTGNFRLFTHYGRLNKTDVYEVRDEYQGKPLNRDVSEKEFEVILKSKLKGKKKQGELGDRVEKYEEVDIASPTVGSENVRGKSIKTIQAPLSKKDISNGYKDPVVSKIINQIIEENIHNISTLTSLKLTTNGFETPLGPVTREHVQKSRIPLDNLKACLKNGQINPDLQIVRDNNAKYFSLIPHPFGHKITRDDWILDEAKLAEEYDLLDNLESAVQMGSALKNASQQKKALGTDIEVVVNSSEINRITTYITSSKAENHRGSDIWGWRVKTIFKIKIPDERKRFENYEKHFGNKKELFHGSKNGNILSILKGGLVIPSVNAGHVTGRMFGDGLYFASNSTKSLNYSTGFWGGRSNKFSNSFLFLGNVCMGKIYETYSPLHSGAPHGYNSIHAKKGSSLYNDEFVVFQLQQASLTYLVEMSK